MKTKLRRGVNYACNIITHGIKTNTAPLRVYTVVTRGQGLLEQVKQRHCEKFECINNKQYVLTGRFFTALNSSLDSKQVSRFYLLFPSFYLPITFQ